MTPFYFGDRAHRLFGVYRPPRGVQGSKARAVLLCNPWGQEYLRAHRSMRQLGHLLGDAGIHVLRFDYFGTGDSAGELSEATLALWRANIVTAVEELLDLSGASRVTLVGLRLGATLAAAVACDRPEMVDALVMWDPVVSGSAYVTQLCRSVGAPPPASPESARDVEVDGFVLTGPWTRDLAALDLTAMVPRLRARFLTVISQEGSDLQPLEAALAATTPARPVERVPDLPAWIEHENSGAGAIPVQVLRRVVEWVT